MVQAVQCCLCLVDPCHGCGRMLIFHRGLNIIYFYHNDNTAPLTTNPIPSPRKCLHGRIVSIDSTMRGGSYRIQIATFPSIVGALQ